MPSTTSSSKRRLLAACALAIAVPTTSAASAEAAQIARVESDGTTYLVFQATPGVSDKLEIFHGPQGVTFSTFMSEDSHQSEDCYAPASNRQHEAVCPTAGVDAVYVDAGDGNDAVNATQASSALGLPIVISGGTGNDTLTGGGADDLLGGEGGDDKLYDSAGADEMDGGDGNDDFRSGLASPGDRVKGGAGVDTAGFGRDRAFTVSLNGQADDGEPGESDAYDEIENLEVSGGGATFIGDDGPNRLSSTLGNGANRFEGRGGNDDLRGGAGNDELIGGDGNDDLFGEDGDDLLDGGAGKDSFIADRRSFTYYAGVGDDTILARDGVDETLNCGPGADRAVVDAGDLVPNDPVTVCEAVDRAAPAAAPGASAGGATPGASATPAAKPSSGDTTSSGLRVAAIRADRLKRALLRGLGVDVVTPAAGKLIVEARRGRTLVAKGTATAHGAGTTKVQVRFTKAARRKLRRARSVTLTLTVRAGEASTTRSLRLK